MATPNRDSNMQQLVPIAPPGKASGSDTGKELVVVDPAGKGSGGVKLREDEEDLEVKLRRIMENVPVRVSNTSGSSAGSGSGDFHQYRQMRRREQDRLARMDADYQKRKELAEFELRREERLKAAEERTAKKRLKRQRSSSGRKRSELKPVMVVKNLTEWNHLMTMKVQMMMASPRNNTAIAFEDAF